MIPTGRDLLYNRYLNKGTAFSAEERQRYRLDGLLPTVVETLEVQLDRVCSEYDACTTDLARHTYLRALQDRSAVLFYAFLERHLAELLPIVYTPTVGLACEQWSRIFRRERGLYLPWPLRERVDELLENALDGYDDVDVVVVTDGERVLGLGDLGIGGMGIPIGKLALYTVAGGIDPARTLPVLLDVGTDNEALLSEPVYLGWRHHRVRGADYDDLVDRFVDALRRRFPDVLLQWEDFAQSHANRLLDRHRASIASFNDDIQGTAAVTTAAIVAGLRISGTPIGELRLVIAGAGSAGTGIAAQVVRAMVAAGLDEETARRRCWLVDRDGLLHDGLDGLAPFQEPFVHPWSSVAAWDDSGDGRVSLLEVVRHTAPHVLVGVTGQAGLFSEEVIRAQADQVGRPIVMPLSNPTPRAEAIPADVLGWTDGRALVGTGSPFAPVTIGGATVPIAQVNNVYVFPGIGLGVVAVRARRVTDEMLTAAVTAVGDLAATGEALLPPISAAREVAVEVARAVARTAVRQGLSAEFPAGEPTGPDAEATLDAAIEAAIDARIATTVWTPEYRPLA